MLRPRPRFSRRSALLAVAGACAATLALPALAQAGTPDWTMSGGQVLVGSSDRNLATLENTVGKKMNIIRRYYMAGDSVPSARDRELANQGRMLHISVKTGQYMYNEVAAGQADAYFKNVLAGLHGLPTKVFFTYQHEVDAEGGIDKCTAVNGVKNHSICGEQFKKAWNRIRNISRTNGYDNRLFFTTVFTGYGWTPATDVRAAKYWPGNANVDVIGADVYDNSCKSDGSKDFATTSAKYVNAWAKQNAPNHPIIVGETGSADDALRDEYINSIRTTLQQPEWSNWKAIEYWNSGGGDCDYTVDTAASQSAFRTLLSTPYFMATKMDRSGTTTTDPDPVVTPSGPTVAITSHTSGQTVSGRITIAGTAKDADGVESVHLRIDDNWKAGDTSAPYSFVLDTRTLSNGQHTIMLRAWDTKGYSGEKAITLTVKN